MVAAHLLTQPCPSDAEPGSAWISGIEWWSRRILSRKELLDLSDDGKASPVYRRGMTVLTGRICKSHLTC
jgi:hypothetical protein